MIAYRDDYAAHVTRYLSSVDEPPPAVYGYLARYAAHALAALGRTGTVLDVGAHVGALATVLPPGCEYEGVEINAAAAARARELGRNVVAEPTRAAYDLVFCRQVIQFARDLPAFVARLASLTAIGGIVCIAQSLPYTLHEAHHWNAADGVGDILPHLHNVEILRASPDETISTAETIILGRRTP